jgi:hypothetical protein
MASNCLTTSRTALALQASLPQASSSEEDDSSSVGRRNTSQGISSVGELPAGTGSGHARSWDERNSAELRTQHAHAAQKLEIDELTMMGLVPLLFTMRLPQMVHTTAPHCQQSP